MRTETSEPKGEELLREYFRGNAGMKRLNLYLCARPCLVGYTNWIPHDGEPLEVAGNGNPRYMAAFDRIRLTDADKPPS